VFWSFPWGDSFNQDIIIDGNNFISEMNVGCVQRINTMEEGRYETYFSIVFRDVNPICIPV